MKKQLLNTLVASSLLCTLTACNTVKVNSKVESQFEGRSIGKTMVLGVLEDNTQARQYEALFVEQLEKQGITSDLLHAYVNNIDNVSKQELTDALIKHNFDSILITRKLSKTERDRIITTGYPNHYVSYQEYYSHAKFKPSTFTQKVTDFELETNLYDVKTQKLVWRGDKIIQDDRSDLSNMKRVISGVAKALKKDGML